MIPWEGMSDYYRDRCRHGGILSNTFIRFWWNRQVITNQYGRPGRAARNWGPDTVEGNLSEEEMAVNRRDQNIDNSKYHFRDEEYYASREYALEDIEVSFICFHRSLLHFPQYLRVAHASFETIRIAITILLATSKSSSVLHSGRTG